MTSKLEKKEPEFYSCFVFNQWNSSIYLDSNHKTIKKIVVKVIKTIDVRTVSVMKSISKMRRLNICWSSGEFNFLRWVELRKLRRPGFNYFVAQPNWLWSIPLWTLCNWTRFDIFPVFVVKSHITRQPNK